MTWWLKDSEVGLGVELYDDERLMGTFATKSDADEVLGMHDLIQAQGRLLDGVVNTIRGAPPADTLWSHHDAVELTVRALNLLNNLGVFAATICGALGSFGGAAGLLITELDQFREFVTMTQSEAFAMAKERKRDLPRV